MSCQSRVGKGKEDCKDGLRTRPGEDTLPEKLELGAVITAIQYLHKTMKLWGKFVYYNLVVLKS